MSRHIYAMVLIHPHLTAGRGANPVTTARQLTLLLELRVSDSRRFFPVSGVQSKRVATLLDARTAYLHDT